MAYAVVTGGARGIGRAIATELASRGYDLVLVSLPGEDLENVAAEIAKKCKKDVKFLELNLTLAEAPQQLYDFTKSLSLEVEVLVNNAGFGTLGPIQNDSLHIHQAGIMVNVHAVLSLTRLYLDDMLAAKKGRIMTLGSTAGLMPVPFKTTYSAAKGYIHTFSRALALELEGTGVTVTCLCPGGTYTNEAVRSRINRAGPISRLAAMEPEAVAKQGVNGLLKGKRFVIPGILNKILTRIARILPYAWYSRSLGKQVNQPER